MGRIFPTLGRATAMWIVTVLILMGGSVSAAPHEQDSEAPPPRPDVQNTPQVLLPCKVPTKYTEAFSKQYCDKLCLELHYACRDGKWEVENYLQEVECSLHDSICRMEPGLYFKGCPVFSEYLLGACKSTR